MEQLKPCPFCGSTNVVAMHNSERDEQIVPGTDVKLNTWMVECQECLSGTGYVKTEQAAIERWNGRVYQHFAEKGDLWFRPNLIKEKKF